MKANILNTLENLSRPELGAVAAKLGIPKGKSRANTQKNIALWINAGKARLSVTVTIRDNSDPKASFPPTLFSKKFRTHKPNKVLHFA